MAGLIASNSNAQRDLWFMEEHSMKYSQPSEWRIVSIRCSVIEARYGSGNFDDAGDDLVAELNSVSDFPSQFPCRFNFDCQNANPYFHTLLFEIQGITDAHLNEFLKRVASLGLEPVIH
jgi:hypothetical protein